MITRSLAGWLRSSTSRPIDANDIHGFNDLLDHLIGASEQLWRHRNAERLGGLEVQEQFDFRGLLYRQVGRLLALEDAVDVAGRAPILVHPIRPVRDQAAAGDEDTLRVDRVSSTA